MTAFARQLATCQRLIARYGVNCTWQIAANGAPVDTSQPWKPTLAGSPTTHTVKIVLVTPKQRTLFELLRALGTEVPEVNGAGLMAGGLSFTPSLKDRVIIPVGGATYTPANFTILQPDGVPLLYRIDWKT